MSNERKENVDEERFGVFRKETRTIRRNSSGINEDTRAKTVDGTGEKSVSCLPVSLESGLYFVYHRRAIAPNLLVSPLDILLDQSRN